jgi:hypothetical protein
MNRGLGAIAILLCLAGTAPAATPKGAPRDCFRRADIEADQGILFQTQLMVASDICHDESYTEFTQRNREIIIRYQHQMIDHFRRSGDRRAESTFDRYITRLANEIALHNGRETTASLCDSEATTLIAKAKILGGEDFHRFALEQATTNGKDYKKCPE